VAQELLTVHSGWSPAASHGIDLQSVHLIGAHAYELYPSVDCPADAFFFDSVHYVLGRPVTYRRSACVFEHTRATPLRRRRYYEFPRRLGGLLDTVLIVRTVIVVDHSDYIIDLVLHQNAVIEAACSITGALFTHYYYSPDVERSGYEVIELMCRVCCRVTLWDAWCSFNRFFRMCCAIRRSHLN